MTAATICARTCRKLGKTAKIAVLEKNAVLGKKLSATGNGKCNMTNLDMDATYFNCKDRGFIEELLSVYPVDRVLSFFESIGIKTVSKNGYVYPMSEQAKSVTECLEREVRHLGISVFTECEVKNVDRQNGGFSVECATKDGAVQIFAKEAIVALGGPAYVYGATDMGERIFKDFGLKYTGFKPALTALCSKDKILKKMAGVRLQAGITLMTDDAHSDTGEIIFNDGSVSGIPVFQISRFMPENCARLKIDLLPALDTEKLADFLKKVSEHNPDTTYEQLFHGILNYKAVYHILERNFIKAENKAGKLNDKEALRLADTFKSFELVVDKTRGFESAQTAAGGLDISEIEQTTLEVKRVPGLFVTGELLDADGICGGYNLHFAWACGMRAGEAAGRLLC